MSSRTKRDIFFYGCMTGLFLATGLVGSVAADNWAYLVLTALGIALSALVILLIHGIAAIADRLWSDDRGMSG